MEQIKVHGQAMMINGYLHLFLCAYLSGNKVEDICKAIAVGIEHSEEILPEIFGNA